MANIVKIPQFDVNSESAKVLEIRVQPNDRVSAGDPIVVFETAKATFDLEAPQNGYVRKILINVGEEYQSQQPAFIFTDTIEEEFIEVVSVEKSPEETPQGRITAKAKYLARKNSKTNLLNRQDSRPRFSSDSIRVPLIKRKVTNFQKGMEASLQYAKQETHSAFLERMVDTTLFGQFIERAKKEKGYIFDPTFAVLAWFYVKSLEKNPALNSIILNDEVVEYQELNLGFTVESKGELYVVTLNNANKLTASEFIDGIFSLQRKAMKKQLEQDHLTGATVGITSLAAFGVTRHQPILPPFTSLMLALSEPIPLAIDGRKFASFGMTYDHRLHTGVTVAGILNRLNNYLQAPDQLWT